MASFYRDILGFDVVYMEEGNCSFLRPGNAGPMIALYPGRESPDDRRAHWFVVIDVENIEKSVEALRQRSVDVSPIEDVPNGRAARFLDPEGNRIEIHQPTS